VEHINVDHHPHRCRCRRKHAGIPGIAGKTLACSAIRMNIIAIAQGSSESNISS